MPQHPRLDQLLCSLGYGNRREVRDLIERGNVELRGEMWADGEVRVDPAQVTFRGEPLEAVDGLLAMLHKPVGYVCTHSSKEGPTIYELLPQRWLKRNPPITTVGRLDKETSGLLLITDQGKLVQRLTSPRAEIEKIYEATVDKPLSAELIEIFAKGDLVLFGEDKPCLPAKLEIIDPLHARLTLSEGRHRQVRRMFASQGWHVEILHRSRLGAYELGDLAPGTWKALPLPGTI